MKKLLVAAAFAVLLLSGCGEEEAIQADPLSLVPEEAMVVMVLNDPAGIVRNIDGYIEDGAPALGASMLEDLICAQLEIVSLDSMPARYGLNPFGTVVFYMESAMPQSMVIAASSPDLPLFLSLMEELGAQFQDEEPIDGNPVYSVDTGDGTMFITGVNGVALMTMARSKLESTIGELSADAAIQVEPASLYMKYNIAMIGPMAAAQMPMARMMMMQGFQEEPDMPQFIPAIMDVYMDGLEIFLTQTDLFEMTVTVGAEDVVFRKNVVFTEGSDLAAVMVPGQERDMLQMIPIGDVANIRFSLPEEAAYQVTKAFTDVFTTEIPDETLRFWASMSASAGMALYSGDEPMNLVAAYDLPEGYTLEDVSVMYGEYLAALMPAFSGNAEFAEAFSVTDNGIVQVDGRDFYNMAMDITGDDDLSMQFNYWMAVHDGALLLETGEVPDKLISVIDGDYQPAEVVGTGTMAGELSLAGYFGIIMAFSPNGMDLPELNTDLLIRWDSSYGDGSVQGEMTMNGRDALATGFTLFGVLSASMSE